ncbi:Calcium-dependent lipid-binding (CaLB domain) family protein [Rhynchospora pubera]|uniref:Calcium-dependent lipid-binding (CaLB domain) family protein n=1 Tax=Rhynchospora pubera TaxID=906938 RepID=A0AAV8D446_9POAL|nr:Calcium-dependent lipid-binding (CaLB domain) family protein [Rhynchospora pubera]
MAFPGHFTCSTSTAEESAPWSRSTNPASTSLSTSPPLPQAPGPTVRRPPVDSVSASKPEWNHPIRLYIDSDQQSSSSDLNLNFDIRTQVPLLGNKLVGSVIVPLSSLETSNGPTDALRQVTYQVRGPGGKPNGVLTFSYILNQSPVVVSDPTLLQESSKLHQGSPYAYLLNSDVATQEVYPPKEKTDSKPQLYPTVDPLENSEPYVYRSRSLFPDPNPQVYPPPPVPDSKPRLYPVISTEPVIAYPVLDLADNGHCQYLPPSVSYPKVEPVDGLASYALPGYHLPPQGSGYYYQERGWDGRFL